MLKHVQNFTPYILSTVPGGKYDRLDGTSMAAPLVAGAISALMMVKKYDNQEVLWGDLLHTDNIIQAYEIANRPAELEVLRIIMRDKNEKTEYEEDDNSYLGYYEVNTGETINLFPVIRTSFGKASNIKLKLLVSSGAQVLTEQVDFGYSLDAFGKMTSKNPLTIKIPDDMPNASEINLSVIATCDEASKTFSKQFVLKVNNMWTLSGLHTKDMILTPDHNYYVSSDFGVSADATLTIQPGTRIEFAKFTGLYAFGKLIANGTPKAPIVFVSHKPDETWTGVFSNDTISYCRVEGFSNYISSWESQNSSFIPAPFKDCVLKPQQNPNHSTYAKVRGKRNVMSDVSGILFFYVDAETTNYINNELEFSPFQSYSLNKSNLVNSFYTAKDGKRYTLEAYSSSSGSVMMKGSSYLGSAREDIVRPFISELGNSYKNDVKATLDLSNMLSEPIREAHGMVWKVLVNGKDAQDEQEEMLPLGVGRHKFEVYFNREMNTSVVPIVSFGVRAPYNQQPVDEDGYWNAEGTVYTVFKTIDGNTQSDGMNRIYVRDAEDDEFFPCPYEATRFNIMIQAAGSLASGFVASAGLGCVDLRWNNENNDFNDAMGFNVYRYSETAEGLTDTIRVNQEILDITTTTFSDYSVKPGTTYYYYYKVLSTALQEYDISNVVSATPLTATRGDANGSGEVDVADVVTTVNYVTGLEPHPFVFDAADMNSDQIIDIFDIVGIIRGILNPNLLATVSATESATYTVEDGTLYIDSPIALAGVQVQLAVGSNAEIKVADDLAGFEQASSWLSEKDYLFIGYSMNGSTLKPGKHALLHIGDAQISTIRLSDVAGRNISVVAGENASTVTRMGKDVMTVDGIYDLFGRKLSPANQEEILQHGVYIINGKKVIK